MVERRSSRQVGPRGLSPETRQRMDEILSLVQENVSNGMIAEQLGLSKIQVGNLKHRLVVEGRLPDPRKALINGLRKCYDEGKTAQQASGELKTSKLVADRYYRQFRKQAENGPDNPNESTGNYEDIRMRDSQIIVRCKAGATVEELADNFGLTQSEIRDILERARRNGIYINGVTLLPIFPKSQENPSGNNKELPQKSQTFSFKEELIREKHAFIVDYIRTYGNTPETRQNIMDLESVSLAVLRRILREGETNTSFNNL